MYSFNHDGKNYTNFSESDIASLVSKGVLSESKAKDIFTSSKLDVIRTDRDNLLLETDWTQIPDAPLTAEKKAEYAAYRQALRDITNNLDDPDNVTWPQKPA